MSKEIKINGKTIGGSAPCFVAVDAGSNHHKSVDTAKELIDEAKKSGADAIKFQTNPADHLYSKYSPKFDRDPAPPLDLLKQVSWPEHLQGGIIERELADYCRKKNIIFFTTPVGVESTDWIADIVPMIKVASFDIDAYQFLSHLASKGRPVVLSTGARFMDEVEEAVQVTEAAGNKDIIILHCTSNYPTNPNELNLRTLETLKKRFPEYPIGLSDHIDMNDSISPRLGESYAKAGIISGGLGVLFGAKFLEKHLTLSRKAKGPDSSFAIQPDELTEYVNFTKEMEKRMKSGTQESILNDLINQYPFIIEMVGDGLKRPVVREFGDPRQKGQRFLYVTRDMRKGQTLTRSDIAELRGAASPDGIKPRYAFNNGIVLAHSLAEDLSANTVLTWKHLGMQPPKEKHRYL